MLQAAARRLACEHAMAAGGFALQTGERLRYNAGMGRESSLGVRATKTRARILEHAEQVFAEHGYDGTRLADIADRVGVKRASMVYYFKDKEELYGAVLSELFGELLTRASELFQQPRDLRERIADMVDLWVDYAWDRPSIARILMREVADAQPKPRPQLLTQTAPFFGLVEAALKEGAKDTDNPQPTAIDPLHFVSAVAGATIFFVSALPALSPGLEKEQLAEYRSEHRGKIRALVEAMLNPPS